MSFHKWPLFGKPKWVGLDAIFLCSRMNDSESLKFTFVYTLTVTPMLFVVAIGTALLCNAKAWGTTFLEVSIFLPVVMSFATASYVWLWLYSEMYGVIVYALNFGFGGENKNLNVWKTGTSSMWAVNAMVT